MSYTWNQPASSNTTNVDKLWIDPTMIVICAQAQLDEAVGPLLESLNRPIGAGLVASVFVHEQHRDELAEKVQAGISQLDPKVMPQELHQRILQRIDCMGAESISIPKLNAIGGGHGTAEGSPVMICDFQQSYWNKIHHSSVVTLHTFRHAQDLIDLAYSEKMSFASAAIWCPKISAAYEIALVLPVPAVYVNCAGISLAPVINFSQKKQTYAALINDHHYAVHVEKSKKTKIIVHPAPV